MRYIYQKKKIDKACFHNGMAYRDFKDLTRRIASDEMLRHKAFIIAKNPKYDGYRRVPASVVYKLLVKELKIRICLTNNYQ